MKANIKLALSAVHLDQDTLDRHIPRIWVERENRIPDIYHKLFLVHTPPGIHSIRDAPTTVPITAKLPSNLRHEINYIVAQLFCLIRLYTFLKLEVGRGCGRGKFCDVCQEFYFPSLPKF